MMAKKYRTGPWLAIILISTLISLAAGKALAQDTLAVTGIIYNHLKQPVSDVSVSVVGSFDLPVVTDQSGTFTVNSGSATDWLIISPANTYKPKRVYLNGRSKVDIYLTPLDMADGQDKVIVMSRAVEKRSIAAAFSTIGIRDIQATAFVTIDEYIQGRASGVNITKRSGHPGSGTFINIRGINSLNASNQPLFLIDGVPVTSTSIFNSNIRGYSFNPLVELNALDVSSITVIKDPAITSAYGSKASNGLILIETLDPSVTKTVIELDLKTGFSLTPHKYIPQLNASQHKTLVQEVLYSSGEYEEDLTEAYPNLFLEPDDERYIDYQHNTKWQDEIFRNSMFTNLNINVKGGDEIATYGLSFGLINNAGTIKSTGYQGYNLRFVSRLNVFRWMKMNAGVSLNYNKSELKESAVSKETSPVLSALGKSPMLNPYQYDEQGREISAVSEVDELGVSNPVAIIKRLEAKNTNSSFVYSMGFDADLNSQLSFKSKFNFTYNTLKENIFMPNHGMEHYYNNEAINVSKAATDNLKSFYNNTYLSYLKKFNDNHSISSMTGFNLQSNNFEFDWGLTKNAHASDEYPLLSHGQDNLREIGGENRKWNWLSIYENLFYTFKDKYMITASISFDGSSRVGDNASNTMKIGDTPFGLFYSAGFAWRLSNESFLKNKSWLEDLKWRISWGKSGNDDIGESSASNYYEAVKFRETVGLYPAVITNDALTYERVTQLNTGIDISLWGNRFAGTFDFYRSQTEDMLIFSPVDAYLGEDYRMENSGRMKNTGWEVYLSGRIKETGNFKWDVQVSLNQVKNEVLDIKGAKLVTPMEGCEIVNMEGSPANSFYGYKFLGVFANTEAATAANLVNDVGTPFRAGDAIYADLSGPEGSPDGVINNYDKTSIGSALPDLSGSLINTFGYKKFRFMAAIQFVQGNDLFNYVRYRNERMSGLENQSVTVLNRWQYEDQITDIPRALYDDIQGNSDFSTRWIEDGSFVRLKNVTLSYIISDEFLTFKNATIYVAANNIVTFSKYLGYDPEFSYSYLQMQQGIDYGLTPQSRQFVVGVKLGL